MNADPPSYYLHSMCFGTVRTSMDLWYLEASIALLTITIDFNGLPTSQLTAIGIADAVIAAWLEATPAKLSSQTKSNPAPIDLTSRTAQDQWAIHGCQQRRSRAAAPGPAPALERWDLV